jgi:2-polyprenyl-3-methyl-5-hydroxy-6-metoxy-1,4-benzoquinol methylase
VVEVKDALLRVAGRALRRGAPHVPLAMRKRVAILVRRLPGRLNDAVIPILLQDWATADPAEYHRFIWSNHLLYAKYYDFRQIEYSRGEYFSKLHPLRVEILEAAAASLRSRGESPDTDVKSILDVGCSLGYLLRYAETTVFPDAHRLVGIDIDSFAIAEGAAYLRGIGSAVELRVADVDGLDSVAGAEPFDLVTCTGVLQYLDEAEATDAVAKMLRHSTKLVVVSGLASEAVDNAQLEHSHVRPYDRSIVHNFDRMVTESGGRVVTRRWAGSEIVDGRHGAYFVVATPGP